MLIIEGFLSDCRPGKYNLHHVHAGWQLIINNYHLSGSLFVYSVWEMSSYTHLVVYHLQLGWSSRFQVKSLMNWNHQCNIT